MSDCIINFNGIITVEKVENITWHADVILSKQEGRNSNKNCVEVKVISYVKAASLSDVILKAKFIPIVEPSLAIHLR